MIPASRLGQIQKASKLMGFAVKNLQDEKIGKVDNLLVDVQSGRIVAVVVSSGGFLGMNDELSAVPPTALRFNSGRDTIQFETTKELLSAAPHFKANQWPDFSQTGYSGGVYSAYNAEPYFKTGADATPGNTRNSADQTVGTKNTDNTGRNVRDRDDRTLTPFDQGNSKADTDTTAQIRKGITADKTMSVNARNVKVITNKGQVTLRGPVNTAEESRLIGDIANLIAGLDNVDNQLEVK
jgi:osmotically-inducible protein OsmY/sporulation protein YlmC with PRC-barrel domain